MKRKTIWVGVASLLFLAIVALGTVLLTRPANFRGTTFGQPYPVAPEIGLTRSDGSRFTLSELQGRVVLLFFGYTSCPDVCPTTLAELKTALDGLGKGKADQVNVLFVTVDPERDTPERVQEYVENFSSTFIGLSGSLSELEKVWMDYGVFREIVEGESAAGYIVNHTARVTVIDQQGNMRISFGFDTPVEDVIHDLKLLLK